MRLTRHVRLLALAMLAGAALATVSLIPAIPQPPGYHDFADSRSVLGIPNFLNVVSNVAFLAVGTWGLWMLWRRGKQVGFLVRRERAPYLAFFSALVLTAAGSAVYHARPSDATLFWDRLPMALCFTALLAGGIGDRLGPRAGTSLLGPLLAGGAAATLYWRLSGNLSFYVLAQYASLAGILLLVALFQPRYTHTADLFRGLALYAVGKLFEILDAPLFALGGLVSGHTVKHLLSAAAAACVLRMLLLRRPLSSPLVPQNDQVTLCQPGDTK